MTGSDAQRMMHALIQSVLTFAKSETLRHAEAHLERAKSLERAESSACEEDSPKAQSHLLVAQVLAQRAERFDTLSRMPYHVVKDIIDKELSRHAEKSRSTGRGG